MKRLLKLTSAFLAVSLVITSVGDYVPCAYAVLSAEKPFKIPAKFGRVEEVYLAHRPGTAFASSAKTAQAQANGLRLGTVPGHTAKTIFYIQDAHDSLEAQENIAKLIPYLVQHYGVKTVYEEGYEGPVPTDRFFDSIQDAGIREKAAYFLMDQLRIGGAEYAHINRGRPVVSRQSSVSSETETKKSDTTSMGVEVFAVAKATYSQLKTEDRRHNFKLIGADNIRLHLKNIAAYRAFAKDQEPIRKDLQMISNELNLLAQQKFPKEFKVWLKFHERYEARQLGLPEYVQRTFEVASRQSSVVSNEVVGRQSSVASIQALRKQFPNLSLLMDLLSAQVNPSERSKISAAIQENLDPKTLFSEINALESAVADRYLETKAARQILDYQKQIQLLKRLTEIQITSAEYQEVKKTLRMVQTQAIANFVAQQAHKPVLLSRRWEAVIRNALVFYETSAARDKSIAKALDDFIANPDEKNAVLVFGGFHHRNIQTLLKQKNLSYYVISPKISKPDPEHEAYYKKLMTVGRHDFEIPLALKTAARAEALFEMGFERTAIYRDALFNSVKSHTRLARPLMVQAVSKDLMNWRPAALALSEMRRSDQPSDRKSVLRQPVQGEMRRSDQPSDRESVLRPIAQSEVRKKIPEMAGGHENLSWFERVAAGYARIRPFEKKLYERLGVRLFRSPLMPPITIVHAGSGLEKRLQDVVRSAYTEEKSHLLGALFLAALFAFGNAIFWDEGGWLFFALRQGFYVFVFGFAYAAMMHRYHRAEATHLLELLQDRNNQETFPTASEAGASRSEMRTPLNEENTAWLNRTLALHELIALLDAHAQLKAEDSSVVLKNLDLTVLRALDEAEFSRREKEVMALVNQWLRNGAIRYFRRVKPADEFLLYDLLAKSNFILEDIPKNSTELIRGRDLRLRMALPKILRLVREGYEVRAVDAKVRGLFADAAYIPGIQQWILDRTKALGYSLPQGSEVYLIVHELIFNMFDHAEGGVLGLRMIREENKDYLELVAWDSGRGMENPEHLRKHRQEHAERHGHGFKRFNRYPAAMTVESLGKRWIKEGPSKPFVYSGVSPVVSGSGTRITLRASLERRSEVRMALDMNVWFGRLSGVKYDSEDDRFFETIHAHTPRFLYARAEEPRIQSLNDILDLAYLTVTVQPGDKHPGGIFQPAPLWRTIRAVKEAGIQSGQTVLDFGHGDGKILFMLAYLFGAQGIGAEWDDFHYRQSEAGRIALEAQHLLRAGQVELSHQNFNNLPIHKADYIFYYSSGAATEQIDIEKIMSQMKPGAKFILLGVQAQDDEAGRDMLRTYYQNFQALLGSDSFSLQRYPDIGAWIFTKQSRSEMRRPARLSGGKSEEGVDWVQRVTAVAKEQGIQNHPGYRVEEMNEFLFLETPGMDEPDRKKTRFRAEASLVLEGRPQPLRSQIFLADTAEQAKQLAAASLSDKLRGYLERHRVSNNLIFPIEIRGEDYLVALTELAIMLRWPLPLFEIQHNAQGEITEVIAELLIPGDPVPLRSASTQALKEPRHATAQRKAFFRFDESSRDLLLKIAQRFPQLMRQRDWVRFNFSGEPDYFKTLETWSAHHPGQLLPVQIESIFNPNAPVAFSGSLELLRAGQEPLRIEGEGNQRGDLVKKLYERMAVEVLGLQPAQAPVINDPAQFQKERTDFPDASVVVYGSRIRLDYDPKHTVHLPARYPLLDSPKAHENIAAFAMANLMALNDPELLIRHVDEELLDNTEWRQAQKALQDFMLQHKITNRPAMKGALVQPMAATEGYPRVRYSLGEVEKTVVLSSSMTVRSDRVLGHLPAHVDGRINRSLLTKLEREEINNSKILSKAASATFPIVIHGDDFQLSLEDLAIRLGWKTPFYRIKKDPLGRVLETVAVLNIPAQQGGAEEFTSRPISGPGEQRNKAARDLLLRFAKRYGESFFEEQDGKRLLKPYLWYGRGGVEDAYAALRSWAAAHDYSVWMGQPSPELDGAPIKIVLKDSRGKTAAESSFVGNRKIHKAMQTASHEVLDKMKIILSKPPLPTEAQKILEKDHALDPQRKDKILKVESGAWLSELQFPKKLGDLKTIDDPSLMHGDRIDLRTLGDPAYAFLRHAWNNGARNLVLFGGVLRDRRRVADLDVQFITEITAEERKGLSAPEDKAQGPDHVRMVYQYRYPQPLVQKSSDIRHVTREFRTSLDAVSVLETQAAAHSLGQFKGYPVEHAFVNTVSPDGRLLVNRPGLTIDQRAIALLGKKGGRLDGVFLDGWGGQHDFNRKSARLVGPFENMGIDTILRAFRLKYALGLRWTKNTQLILRRAAMLMAEDAHQAVEGNHPVKDETERIKLQAFWTNEAQKVFRDAPDPHKAYQGLRRFGLVEPLSQLGVDVQKTLQEELSRRSEVRQADKPAARTLVPRQPARGEVRRAQTPIPEKPEDMQIYELNARAYFKEKRIKTFADFTDAHLQKIKNSGFNTIWLMGVWVESTASRELNEYWEKRNEENEKRVASAYAIPAYTVNPNLGSQAQLRRFVRRANRLGIRIILDFIPNHFASDSPLIDQHPDWFVHSRTRPRQLKRYFEYQLSGGRGSIWVAYARDSLNPGAWSWTDAAQLNLLNPEVWDFMEAQLNKVSDLNRGNGTRFDAIDSIRLSEFHKLWKKELAAMGYTDTKAYRSYKPILERLKARYPQMVTIGESHRPASRKYWAGQGFDLFYEPRVRDWLLSDHPGSESWRQFKNYVLRQEEFSGPLPQALPLLYLENHDVSYRMIERARHQLGKDSADDADVRALAGLYAVAISTIPGVPLVYQGQEDGKVLTGPDAIHLRSVSEKGRPAVSRVYRKLFSITRRDVFRRGSLPEEIPMAESEPRPEALLAFKRQAAGETGIVLMNHSAEPLTVTLDYFKAGLGADNATLTLFPWESRVQVIESGNPRKILAEFFSRSKKQAQQLEEISRLLQSLGSLHHGRFHPYNGIFLRIQSAAADASARQADPKLGVLNQPAAEENRWQEVVEQVQLFAQQAALAPFFGKDDSSVQKFIGLLRELAVLPGENTKTPGRIVEALESIRIFTLPAEQAAGKRMHLLFEAGQGRKPVMKEFRIVKAWDKQQDWNRFFILTPAEDAAQKELFMLKSELGNREWELSRVVKGDSLVPYQRIRNLQGRKMLLSAWIRGPDHWMPHPTSKSRAPWNDEIYRPPALDDFLEHLQMDYRDKGKADQYFQAWTSLLASAFAAVSQVIQSGYYYDDSLVPNMWVTEDETGNPIVKLGDFEGAGKLEAAQQAIHRDEFGFSRELDNLVFLFLRSAQRSSARYAPFKRILNATGLDFKNGADLQRWASEVQAQITSALTASRSEVRTASALNTDALSSFPLFTVTANKLEAVIEFQERKYTVKSAEDFKDFIRQLGLTAETEFAGQKDSEGSFWVGNERVKIQVNWTHEADLREMMDVFAGDGFTRRQRYPMEIKSKVSFRAGVQANGSLRYDLKFRGGGNLSTAQQLFSNAGKNIRHSFPPRDFWAEANAENLEKIWMGFPKRMIRVERDNPLAVDRALRFLLSEQDQDLQSLEEAQRRFEALIQEFVTLDISAWRDSPSREQDQSLWPLLEGERSAIHQLLGLIDPMAALLSWNAKLRFKPEELRLLVEKIDVVLSKTQRSDSLKSSLIWLMLTAVQNDPTLQEYLFSQLFRPLSERARAYWLSVHLLLLKSGFRDLANPGAVKRFMEADSAWGLAATDGRTFAVYEEMARGLAAIEDLPPKLVETGYKALSLVNGRSTQNPASQWFQNHPESIRGFIAGLGIDARKIPDRKVEVVYADQERWADYLRRMPELENILLDSGNAAALFRLMSFLRKIYGYESNPADQRTPLAEALANEQNFNFAAGSDLQVAPSYESFKRFFVGDFSNGARPGRVLRFKIVSDPAVRPNNYLIEDTAFTYPAEALKDNPAAAVERPIAMLKLPAGTYPFFYQNGQVTFDETKEFKVMIYEMDFDGKRLTQLSQKELDSIPDKEALARAVLHQTAQVHHYGFAGWHTEGGTDVHNANIQVDLKPDGPFKVLSLDFESYSPLSANQLERAHQIERDLQTVILGHDASGFFPNPGLKELLDISETRLREIYLEEAASFGARSEVRVNPADREILEFLGLKEGEELFFHGYENSLVKLDRKIVVLRTDDWTVVLGGQDLKGTYSKAARQGKSHSRSASIDRLRQFGDLGLAISQSKSGELNTDDPFVTLTRLPAQIFGEKPRHHQQDGHIVAVYEIPAGAWVIDRSFDAERVILIPHHVPIEWLKAIVVKEGDGFMGAYGLDPQLKTKNIKVLGKDEMNAESLSAALAELGYHAKDFAATRWQSDNIMDSEHDPVRLTLSELMRNGSGGTMDGFWVTRQQTLLEALHNYPLMAQHLKRITLGDLAKLEFQTQAGERIALDTHLEAIPDLATVMITLPTRSEVRPVQDQEWVKKLMDWRYPWTVKQILELGVAADWILHTEPEKFIAWIAALGEAELKAFNDFKKMTKVLGDDDLKAGFVRQFPGFGNGASPMGAESFALVSLLAKSQTLYGATEQDISAWALQVLAASAQIDKQLSELAWAFLNKGSPILNNGALIRDQFVPFMERDYRNLVLQEMLKHKLQKTERNFFLVKDLNAQLSELFRAARYHWHTVSGEAIFRDVNFRFVPDPENPADVLTWSRQDAVSLPSIELVKNMLLALPKASGHSSKRVGTVRVEVKRVGGNIRYTFKNSGQPVPELDSEKIFLPHLSSRPKEGRLMIHEGKGRAFLLGGRGHGLFFARMIAELHGGSLVYDPAQNMDDQGRPITTFVLTFPAAFETPEGKTDTDSLLSADLTVISTESMDALKRKITQEIDQQNNALEAKEFDDWRYRFWVAISLFLGTLGMRILIDLVAAKNFNPWVPITIAGVSLLGMSTLLLRFYSFTSPAIMIRSRLTQLALGQVAVDAELERRIESEEPTDPDSSDDVIPARSEMRQPDRPAGRPSVLRQPAQSEVRNSVTEPAQNKRERLKRVEELFKRFHHQPTATSETHQKIGEELDDSLGLRRREIEAERVKPLTRMLIDGHANGDVSAEAIHALQASDYWLLQRFLSHAGLTAEDVFYDLGSGYGRAVFYAALASPVKKAVGIELVDWRVDEAERVRRELGLENVSFLKQNVREASLEEGTVFYMFSPFYPDTLRVVGDKLKEVSKLKKIKIIANGDSMVDFFRKNGDWLKVIYEDGDGVIFESIPTPHSSDPTMQQAPQVSPAEWQVRLANWRYPWTLPEVADLGEHLAELLRQHPQELIPYFDAFGRGDLEWFDSIESMTAALGDQKLIESIHRPSWRARKGFTSLAAERLGLAMLLGRPSVGLDDSDVGDWAMRVLNAANTTDEYLADQMGVLLDERSAVLENSNLVRRFFTPLDQRNYRRQMLWDILMRKLNGDADQGFYKEDPEQKLLEFTQEMKGQWKNQEEELIFSSVDFEIVKRGEGPFEVVAWANDTIFFAPFLEVLKNAAAALPKAHTGSMRRMGKVRVEITRKGRDIQYVISNTGHPVPELDSENIFLQQLSRHSPESLEMIHVEGDESDEEFNFYGDGVGLSLARAFVELYGGSLVYDPAQKTDANGQPITTFVLTLPAAEYFKIPIEGSNPTAQSEVRTSDLSSEFNAIRGHALELEERASELGQLGRQEIYSLIKGAVMLVDRLEELVFLQMKSVPSVEQMDNVLERLRKIESNLRVPLFFRDRVEIGVLAVFVFLLSMAAIVSFNLNLIFSLLFVGLIFLGGAETFYDLHIRSAGLPEFLKEKTLPATSAPHEPMRSEMRTASEKKETYTISQADPKGYANFSREAELLAVESRKKQDRDGEAMFQLLAAALKFPHLMIKLWVVRDRDKQNKVIGFYALVVDPRLGWQGYLDEQKRYPGIKTAMAISVDYRGQGIATALWNQGLEFLRSQSIRYVVDTPISEKSFQASKHWAAAAGAALIPMGLAPKFKESSRSFLMDLTPAEKALDWLAADAVAPHDVKTLEEWLQWIKSSQIQIGNIYRHEKNGLEVKVVGLNSLTGSFTIQPHAKGLAQGPIQIIPPQNVKTFLSEFIRPSIQRPAAQSEVRSGQNPQSSAPEVVRLYQLLDQLIDAASLEVVRISELGRGWESKRDSQRAKTLLLREVKKSLFGDWEPNKGDPPAAAILATTQSFERWKTAVADGVNVLRTDFDHLDGLERALEGSDVFVLNRLWREYRQAPFEHSQPESRLTQAEFDSAWTALLEPHTHHRQSDLPAEEWSDANGLAAVELTTKDAYQVRLVRADYFLDEYQIWYWDSHDWVRVDKPLITIIPDTVMHVIPNKGGLVFNYRSRVFDLHLIELVPSYQQKGIGETYFKWQIDYAAGENLMVKYSTMNPVMISLAKKYRKSPKVLWADFSFKENIEDIPLFFVVPCPIYNGTDDIFRIQLQETRQGRTIVIQDAKRSLLRTLAMTGDSPMSFTVGTNHYQIRLRNSYSVEIKEGEADWKTLQYAKAIHVRIATHQAIRSEVRQPAQPADSTLVPRQPAQSEVQSSADVELTRVAGELKQQYQMEPAKAVALAKEIEGAEIVDGENGYRTIQNKGQTLVEVSKLGSQRYFDLNGRWILTLDPNGNKIDELEWDSDGQFVKAWTLTSKRRGIVMNREDGGDVARVYWDDDDETEGPLYVFGNFYLSGKNAGDGIHLSKLSSIPVGAFTDRLAPAVGHAIMRLVMTLAVDQKQMPNYIDDYPTDRLWYALLNFAEPTWGDEKGDRPAPRFSDFSRAPSLVYWKPRRIEQIFGDQQFVLIYDDGQLKGIDGGYLFYPADSVRISRDGRQVEYRLTLEEDHSEAILNAQGHILTGRSEVRVDEKRAVDSENIEELMTLFRNQSLLRDFFSANWHATSSLALDTILKYGALMSKRALQKLGIVDWASLENTSLSERSVSFSLPLLTDAADLLKRYGRKRDWTRQKAEGEIKRWEDYLRSSERGPGFEVEVERIIQTEQTRIKAWDEMLDVDQAAFQQRLASQYPVLFGVVSKAGLTRAGGVGMHPEMTSTKQKFKFWESKTGNRLVFVIVPRINMPEFKEQLRPLLVLNLPIEQVEEFLQKRVISKEAFDTFMHPDINLPWLRRAMRPFVMVKSGDRNIPYPSFSRLWEDLNQQTDEYLQPRLNRWADKLEQLLTGRSEVRAEILRRPLRLRRTQNDRVKSEMAHHKVRRVAADNDKAASPAMARTEPDVQVFANKRILINFADMVKHFSDKEILEVLGIAQKQNQNVQTLIYNLDFTVDFRFARFLKSLESEQFKVEALSLEQITKKYTQGFSGEALHLSSASYEISAQQLQQQLKGSVPSAQVYSFSYQDEASGTLGVGLRDLSAGLLKRDLLQADELRKPGYFGYDKNGNLIITDAAQAGTAAWIQSYDRVLVFSRAA